MRLFGDRIEIECGGALHHHGISVFRQPTGGHGTKDLGNALAAFDLGAESVQSVELVAAFEEEFGINMDEDAALSVDTVGGAVKFITQVCKEQNVKV